MDQRRNDLPTPKEVQSMMISHLIPRDTGRSSRQLSSRGRKRPRPKHSFCLAALERFEERIVP